MDGFGDDDREPDDGVFHQRWMGAAIPFLIIAGFFFCGLVLYSHRRKMIMQRGALPLNQPGYMAYQQASPEDGYGGHGQPPANGYYGSGAYAPVAPGQQQQNAARGPGGWRQWAAWRPNGGGRNARPAVHTEGLDENGQAPPPYMRDGIPDKMAAEAEAAGEHIELLSAPASAHVRQSGNEREVGGEPDRMHAAQTGASLAPPAPASSVASASPFTLPPAYSEVVAPKRS